MAQTVIRGTQILNNTVQRQDLDVATVGQAVVTKIVQGTGIVLSSTGADSGTGDVTVSGGTPTAHEASHVTGTDQIPNASSSARGLLALLSGNTTDYVGGDNSCHNLVAAIPNGYALDTGTATAYVVANTVPYLALRVGLRQIFVPLATNTGAATLNVDGLGAVTIVNPAGFALTGGEIAANAITQVVYQGTNFRIVGPCSKMVVSLALTAPTGIECAGCTSVTAYLGWTSGAGQGITLSHVAPGTQLKINALNSTGANMALVFAANDPAGTAFTTINGVKSGGSAFTNLLSPGLTLGAGVIVQFSGSPHASGSLIFIY